MLPIYHVNNLKEAFFSMGKLETNKTDVPKNTPLQDGLDDAAFLKEIADASPAIIFVYDLFGKEIVYINNAVKELLGYSDPGFLLRNKNIFKEIAHPDDYEKWTKHIDLLHSLKDRETVDIKVRLKAANNTYRWFHICESTFKRGDSGRTILSTTGTMYNISETSHPDFKLSPEFISFLENSPASVMVLKAVRNNEGTVIDFEYIFASKKALLATRKADLAGKYMNTEFPGAKKIGLFDHYVRLMQKGEYWADEVYYDGDGFRVWSKVNATRLDDWHLVTYFETNERKVAGKEERNTTAHFSDPTDAFLELDKNGNLFSINNTALELFQMKKEEMIGRNIWEIFPQAKKSLSYEAIQVRALNNKKFAQFEYRSEVLGTMISLSAGPTAQGCIIIFHKI